MSAPELLPIDVPPQTGDLLVAMGGPMLPAWTHVPGTGIYWRYATDGELPGFGRWDAFRGVSPASDEGTTV